jgi:hypothetical protein
VREHHVIPSERSESVVIPSERSESVVIPSERSESRDLHSGKCGSLDFARDDGEELGMTAGVLALHELQSSQPETIDLLDRD